MFQLDDRHVAAFVQAVQREVRSRLLQHVRDFFPEQCKALGEDALRDVVDEGIERASSYQLSHEGPIRHFLELMFTLGSDFDLAFRPPSAQQILKSHELSDHEKMERLMRDAVQYLERAETSVGRI